MQFNTKSNAVKFTKAEERALDSAASILGSVGRFGIPASGDAAKLASGLQGFVMAHVRTAAKSEQEPHGEKK